MTRMSKPPTPKQQLMWHKLHGQPGNYYVESTEPERKEFRQYIRDVLQEGIVQIEFRKADESIRVMNCTLSETHGAKYMVKENTTVETLPAKINNDVCKIWDIDQSAWRSFRWDRLKSFTFTIG